MQPTIGLIIVWILFGLLIGTGIYLMTGGNLYFHLAIGMIAAVCGGMFALRRRK